MKKRVVKWGFFSMYFLTVSLMDSLSSTTTTGYRLGFAKQRSRNLSSLKESRSLGETCLGYPEENFFNIIKQEGVGNWDKYIRITHFSFQFSFFCVWKRRRICGDMESGTPIKCRVFVLGKGNNRDYIEKVSVMSIEEKEESSGMKWVVVGLSDGRDERTMNLMIFFGLIVEIIDNFIM